MKAKPNYLALLLLLAGSLCSASAQNPLPPVSSSDAARAQPSDSRAVSSTAPVLSVTVSAEAWAGDFVSYQSGENFIVIVPQAKTSAIRWHLSGQGLAGIQVEQRGDDVFVTMRVTAANKPGVRQEGNRFEIQFAATGSTFATASGPNTVPQASAAEVVAERASETATANVVTPTAPTTPPAAPAARGAPPNAPSAAPQDFRDLVRGFVGANTTADSLNLDLLTPESPAFAVLGLTPQTVIRPATPQQLATSLINGLDENGNFQNGFAIDTAPYMLINGENVTIRDYMDQYLTRLLSRTQFSFGVTKGSSSDDLATRVAAGLNFTLWDRGDPRVHRPGEEGDVLDCFIRNLDSTIPIPPTIDPDDAEQVRNFVAPELARLKPLADQCRAAGEKARWNRSAWTLAYAPSWISRTGANADLKWNGGAFWTSLAYGFEEVPSLRKMSQLIFHARYRSREQVADDANPGQFLTQNTLFLGARFRAGSPKFALNFEDGFLRTRTLGGGTDSANRFSIGTEFRLTDKLYFVISAGGHAGRTDGKSNGFVLSSFKYGFNKQPQLTPQP